MVGCGSQDNNNNVYTGYEIGQVMVAGRDLERVVETQQIPLPNCNGSETLND